MEAESARNVLGLNAATSADEIERAYETRRRVIEERMATAPTEGLRLKYQKSLAELAEARGQLTAFVIPAVPSLTATQFADLPGAAPIYTSAGFTPVGPAPPTLAPGVVLLDRYEVRAPIGIGGMGVVYRAFDRNRSEEIAIKVLLPQLLANLQARERFLAEAKIASTLSHPNIVNVFDVQRDGGNDFLTMELLHGQTLRQQMAARKAGRQSFEIDEVLTIARALCAALGYAHRFTVHRDVKPENIWIDDDGGIKLMDFGIARVLSTSQLTQTTTTLGTAYYMAPEQLRGAKTVDGRADQYSLAVMLYELIVGEIPAGKIRSLSSVEKRTPKGLSLAIDKALDSQPDGRYPDMAAFGQALGSRSNPFTGLPSWTKWAGLAAVLLIGLVLALPVIKGLIPNSTPGTDSKSVAVESQGAIGELMRRLEGQERELDNRVRDARSAVERLDGMDRMARTESEKTDLAQRLAEAQAKLEMATQVQEIASESVFSSERMVKIKGQQTLGEGTLRDGQVDEAARILSATREELESMLNAVAAIENSLKERNQLRAQVEEFADIVRKEGDQPETVMAKTLAKQTQAEAAVSSGDYSAALIELGNARTVVRQEMGAYIAGLVDRHAKSADAALNSGDVGKAEAELNRAKTFDRMRAQLKQG